ncbi:hypothetical protein DFR64_0597 [Pelolinea submarina]|uniref:Uncharacterized protein n=1 Tax=Pelolinea submarina TaxID=913107 RepID=A0A3E0AGH8_9CHLR|nr:hypothetical protein DFR64_0597 [Pelolinea submarina]
MEENIGIYQSICKGWGSLRHSGVFSGHDLTIHPYNIDYTNYLFKPW